jgi:serine phosphatase RsbU (regulator of sigma subunit)/transcriptional regulator with GAF, ATPase, and Fis domain
MRAWNRQGLASQGLLVPPERWRLWVGLTIGVAGPILLTPVVEADPFSGLPGVPYVLAVVGAAYFGRLLAGAAATAVSVVLLDRYVIADADGIAAQGGRGVIAIAIFILVAIGVSHLLVRLDRAVQAEEVELDRLSLLASAGDAVSGSLELDATLQRLADVLVPTLADWFSVDLVDESGAIRSVLVVHPDPSRIEAARALQERFPTDPDAPTGVPHVIRTGTSELTERITPDMLRALVPDRELLGAIRDLGLRCAMVVPLTARDRTIGALTLIGAETHERYGRADLGLAEEIADRAALAIDTARLFSAESRARAAALAEAERSAALQDATAAFGRATTVEEVMTTMLEEGIRRAGAAAGTVGLVADADRVDLLGTSGYELDDSPYWHSFRLNEALPLSEAIRDRRPVVVSSTAERDRRYPALVGRGDQRDHALVCLPLLLGDTAIGGFSASYPPEMEFGDDDLAFLRALGEQCAQAVQRARSVQRETATRARFDALASASRALARTLDYEATAGTVVRLAVEHLGRAASLYAHERSGLALLASAGADGVRTHVDPSSPPLHPDGRTSATITRAFRQRAPQLLDPPAEEGGGPAPPGLVLPLGIADLVSNALVVAEPIRDFRDADELAFAREVARRMARAMENARLYRERDSVARTLQQSLLPSDIPDVPGVEIEALFQPAVRGYDVGGDFYDVFETTHGGWAVVIGDVCGKGVEAATLTGLARHTLRALSDVDRPSEALAALNRALLRERLDGRFITVAYALLEPNAGGGVRVRLASGGHPLPQRVSSAGGMERVGRHGTLLGVTPDARLEDVEIALDPGSALVLFTDGILKKDEVFGDVPRGLVASLGGSPLASIADARERIEHYVRDLVAEGQDDDIAILVLRAR